MNYEFECSGTHCALLVETATRFDINICHSYGKLLCYVFAKNAFWLQKDTETMTIGIGNSSELDSAVTVTVTVIN